MAGFQDKAGFCDAPRPRRPGRPEPPPAPLLPTSIRGNSSGRTPAAACRASRASSSSSCHQPASAQSRPAIAARFARSPCSRCSAPRVMPWDVERGRAAGGGGVPGVAGRTRGAASWAGVEERRAAAPAQTKPPASQTKGLRARWGVGEWSGGLQLGMGARPLRLLSLAIVLLWCPKLTLLGEALGAPPRLLQCGRVVVGDELVQEDLFGGQRFYIIQSFQRDRGCLGCTHPRFQGKGPLVSPESWLLPRPTPLPGRRDSLPLRGAHACRRCSSCRARRGRGGRRRPRHRVRPRPPPACGMGQDRPGS
jgi:hypothetical protein